MTSVIRYFDAPPEFTLAAPTFNREAMEALAALGPAPGRILGVFAGPLWPFLGRLLPWAFRRGLFGRPGAPRARGTTDPARMTNLFAIGRDSANGRLRLKRGRLDVEWDYARENAALIANMKTAMEEIAGAYVGDLPRFPRGRSSDAPSRCTPWVGAAYPSRLEPELFRLTARCTATPASSSPTAP